MSGIALEPASVFWVGVIRKLPNSRPTDALKAKIRPEIDQFEPTRAHAWPFGVEFDIHCANCDQMPNWAETWSMLANYDKFGATFAEIGPTSASFGQIWVESRLPRQLFDSCWTIVRQLLGNSGARRDQQATGVTFPGVWRATFRFRVTCNLRHRRLLQGRRHINSGVIRRPRCGGPHLADIASKLVGIAQQRTNAVQMLVEAPLQLVEIANSWPNSPQSW